MDHKVESRYAACALSPRSVWWENQVEALDDGRLSVCRWCVCGVECEKLVQGQTLNVGIRRAGRDFRSKRMGNRAVLGGAGLFIEAAVATSGRNPAGIAAVAPGFHSFSAVSSATLATGCTQSGAVARPA